jgi:hypothetical protein
MILDRLFIHLRSRDLPEKFLASRVLSFYGRLLIGAPRPEQIPSPDKKMRQRLADTYFDIKEDRPPTKQNDNWKIGMLWLTQLRVEEEKQVARAAFIWSAVLCTALVAAGGMLHTSTTGIEGWWKARQAKAEAAERAEYAAKRAALQKEWAEEISGYSAQRCLDEASKLRVRDTDEKRDHYAAIEQGCTKHRNAIADIGKSWSMEQCVEFARKGNAQLNEQKGQQTWADFQVFQMGCITAHDPSALQALIKE